ncbi:PEP-CTERM sorting domain-containing protein [Methylomarinum vadi]|uniref:PEP-CTERM sorting domain-containing protein n=1 Tax=Methylomarinum vadi TaxID=438855 RepID=UPI0004DEF69C|nr:PEP-CTERM sorting domain-containing protein [Methylomarinum vadi]
MALSAAAVLWSTSSLAALQNGNFSDGFNGWQGQVYDDTNGYVTVNPASNTNNYGEISDGAQLTTSYFEDGIWSVALYQDFSFQSVAVGNTLELSLGLTISTDNLADIAFAQLEDPTGTLLTLDLLDGGTFDVTAWAGQSASISFGIQDNAGAVPDFLQVHNIVITEKAAAVPEPPILVLIGTGLIALRRKFF